MTTREAMRRLTLIGVGLTFAVGLTGQHAAGQQARGNATAPPTDGGRGRGPLEITVTDVGKNVWMFSAGSNAVLVAGTDGAILVDTLLPNAQGLAGKVAAVTTRPIKYVINTHYHGDHTGNNEAFGRSGTVIVSTTRAAELMANPPAFAVNAGFGPLPLDARPKETFTGTKTITVGGVQAVATQVPTAHTEGDAYVFFPDLNVLVMGDLHHSNEYPVWNGSYAGNLQAYDMALKLVNDRTQIVPGHGPVTNKADMTRYVAMLRRVRDQIDASIAQTKSADEVVAMQPLAGDASPYPGGPDNRERFIRALYDAEKTGQGK